MFGIQCATGILALCAVLSFAAQDVPLNQIQVLHAHNSFHVAPQQSVLDFLNSQLVTAFLGDTSEISVLETLSHSLEYSYPSITDLLDTWGVRSFELDCYYDPDGGIYSNPAAKKLITNLDFNVPALEETGWKVLHIPDIDFNSSCFTLKGCLRHIKSWSSANPDHTPIFISIEPTVYDPESSLGASAVSVINTLLRTTPGDPQSLTESLPITSRAFGSLIDEILSVFNQSEIILPSEVQQNASSLLSSVRSNGWPKISELRGRVLFIMSPPYLQALLRRYPDLVDSPIFPSAYTADDEEEHTVFIAVQATEPGFPRNTSLWEEQVEQLTDEVRSTVKDGYIVRAFADYSTQEARANYTYRRDQILKAGAHLVATDFPGEIISTFFETNYTVVLNEKERDIAVVCNPQTANSSCRRIEHIKKASAPDSDSIIQLDLEPPSIAEEDLEEDLEDNGSRSLIVTNCFLLVVIATLVQSMMLI